MSQEISGPVVPPSSNNLIANMNFPSRENDKPTIKYLMGNVKGFSSGLIHGIVDLCLNPLPLPVLSLR